MSLTVQSEFLEDEQVVSVVRLWVNSMVVDMNLCPFAKRELVKNRVRFSLTEAITEEQLLMALQAELEWLNSESMVETTLLIHPKVLQEFSDYNQFLDLADSLLVQMGLEGIYQIASFHPDYQFAGAGPDDAENYTNRSPFPLLHLIREESLERVIADYPDVDEVPSRNIELMNSLGNKKLQAVMQACFKDPENGNL